MPTIYNIIKQMIKYQYTNTAGYALSPWGFAGYVGSTVDI